MLTSSADRQREPLREMPQRHGEKETSVVPNEKHQERHCRCDPRGSCREANGRSNGMRFDLAKLELNGKNVPADIGKLSSHNHHHPEKGKCSSSQASRGLYIDAEDLFQDLLPRISNRITIESVLTKISWKTLCTLATLNRTWRHAIQSRLVYRARSCLSSSKSLVLISHRAQVASVQNPAGTSAAEPGANYLTSRSGRFVPMHWRYGISMYNPDDNAWHRLPPIPGVSCGIPKACGCVYHDGKVYVIGGDDYDKLQSKSEVYALDLGACRSQWQQCASMMNARSDFPCVVHNGKIYVFGGGHQPEMNYSRDAEVFDPQRNEWQSIADMLHQRTNHTAVTLEGKVYVLGGSVWLDEEDDLLYQRLDCDDMFDSTLLARFAEVYDLWKKSWRKVENVTKRERDDAFVVVHGKLHVLRPNSVHVYDTSSNTWELLQQISWELQADIEAKDCCVCAAAFVEGELLALVGRTSDDDYGIILVRSKNLHREDRQITWEAIDCPRELDSQFLFLYPVQL